MGLRDPRDTAARAAAIETNVMTIRSKIQVVHKRPLMLAEVVTIDNTLKALQDLLDGGCLSAIQITPGVHAYVDDEGLLKKLQLNFVFYDEPIVGPVVFSKVDASGDEIGFESEKGALEFCAVLNKKR
jgi:hypothetical protein